MKTPCDHYVRDLLFELIHRGRAVCETVRANKQSGEGDRAEFAAGHAFGYYKVVSYMLQ